MTKEAINVILKPEQCIDEIVGDVVAQHPAHASNAKNGDDQEINYLTACVVKRLGGNVSFDDARDRVEERVVDRIVDVTLPYDDQYNTSEKIVEIDNIPDTKEARETFRYPPVVRVTFEWDKDRGSLQPQSVEIDGELYEL